MRKKTKLFTIVFLIFASAIDVLAQDVKLLEQGYHVIVGTFKIHDNAKHFTETLSQRGMTVSYGTGEDSKFYYVSSGSYSTLDEALRQVTAIRRDTAFYDAWIKAIGKTEPLPAALVETQPAAITSTPDDSASLDSASLENAPEEKIVQHEQITLENTEIFLSLFNAKNNRVIEGKVKVIDAGTNKLLAEVDGNRYLTLPAEVKEVEKLILLCEITGFRKVQVGINYSTPLVQDKEALEIELFGTSIVVNFEMVPYVKGDIITLYNVYFFNDAAVMQPQSQYELNQVVQMLKDSPEQRIRLHGHTNGNYTGPIIKVGASKNYFALENTERKIGTSRELAEERAQIIKDYLVDNGISAERVEIKSWGGKRPIYDKNSNRAKLNVRVEVEIL